MDRSYKFRLGFALVALLTTPVASQVDCTKIMGTLCDQLKAASNDSTVFEIQITLHRPPFDPYCRTEAGKVDPKCKYNDSGDSTYWATLEKELDHLFTTYDLRDSLNQRFLTPRQMDWEITMAYADLFTTKKTILGILKEDYVTQIVSWAGVGPAASSRSQSNRSAKYLGIALGYLVNGRRVTYPISSNLGKRPPANQSGNQILKWQ